ncbi:hypothetical protein ACI2I2_20040 [Scandinavium sp. NPDC088450]|uniref:hypothetical protein n=1 Tax=Scandinavium sp. NPDC088450 TaxID=3364514 RepID=UPI00384D902A
MNSALAGFIHRITVAVFSETVGNFAAEKARQFPCGEQGRAEAPAALPLLPLRLLRFDACWIRRSVLFIVLLSNFFLLFCRCSRFHVNHRAMAPFGS